MLRRCPGEREREILDGLVLDLVLSLIFGEFFEEHDRLDVAFVREVEVGPPLALVVGDEITVGVDVTGQNSTSFVVPELVVDGLEEVGRMYLRLEWFLVGFGCVFGRFRVDLKVGFCWCLLFFVVFYRFLGRFI